MLAATQVESELTLDGSPVTATRLITKTGLWAAGLDHGELSLTACARDIDPASLRFEPLGDPERLLGPEPRDA